MEWIQWSKKRLYTIREIWWIVLSFILTICTLINLTLTLLKKKKKYKHLYLLHKLFFSMNVLFHFWASARMWLAKWSSCPAISCNGAATHLPLRTVFFLFLISLAFCRSCSFFVFNLSFISLGNSLFLSSIIIATRKLLISICSPGDSCKIEQCWKIWDWTHPPKSSFHIPLLPHL